MEIGISTACYFTALPIEDAVLDIAAHGTTLCELFLNSFCEYEASFIDLLEERVNKSGLRVYSVHPMSMQFEPQLFSLHPRQRADAWTLYERVLTCAKRLGATHYVMHGPARLSGAAKNISLERLIPILRELSELARSYGVKLLLENVSWCIFDRPEVGRRLADALDAETLAFTLDVKQALRSGFDPLDFLDAVDCRIENVHLCDASRDIDGMLHYAMPGKGAYDFRALFARLEGHRYQGPAFLEVYSDMFSSIDGLYVCLEKMRALT